MTETLAEYLERKRRCVCPPFRSERECYIARYYPHDYDAALFDDGRCDCPCHDEDREHEDEDDE